MKALYSSGTPVASARVLRDHRTALIPLGVALAINLVVLAGVVLPLSRRVAANERRAEAAAQAEHDANNEFRQAEAVREGKARATTDLDTFYRQVLPADVTAARRAVQKVRMLALEHDVDFERGATDIEEIRDSSLERFTVTMTLSGDYDNIRALLYSLETAQEFVVVDKIVLAEGLDTNAPLALSLELSTYYRAPSVAQAPAPRQDGGGSSGAGNGR
jgi:hypothetical protein